MFYPNPDGEYNRSTAQASSGTYSLYLNAHTHNGNHYGPNIIKPGQSLYKNQSERLVLKGFRVLFKHKKMLFLSVFFGFYWIYKSSTFLKASLISKRVSLSTRMDSYFISFIKIKKW